jgi:hypothetical protein
MGYFLTTSSVLMCPHGATIQASTSNTRVKADGAYVLRSSDTFSIAGCPFMTGPTPSPCTQVEWVTEALNNSVGDKVLTDDSVGMCIGSSGPQGTVLVQQTQSKAQGT